MHTHTYANTALPGHALLGHVGIYRPDLDPWKSEVDSNTVIAPGMTCRVVAVFENWNEVPDLDMLYVYVQPTKRFTHITPFDLGLTPLDEGATSYDDDVYTGKPTFIRIYWEDHGDEFPWCIDGVDSKGHPTEEVLRYAALAEALATVPAWVKRYNLEPEKEWIPMTLPQIELYLIDRGWSVDDLGVPGVTEVRETKHGVEYR